MCRPWRDHAAPRRRPQLAQRYAEREQPMQPRPRLATQPQSKEPIK